MTPTRKEQERAQRRNLILEAALRIFGRKPFDEASMQEVAAEAQIGMQGLYEHFQSKQDLYEQVMLHRAKAFQQRAEELLATARKPIDQLRALAQAYAEQAKNSPMSLPLFIRDRVYFDWDFDSRFAARTREIYEAEMGRVKGILSRIVDAGLLRPIPLDFLTQLCLGAMEASLNYHHRNGIHEEVKTCVDRAMDCFFQGVGSRP